MTTSTSISAILNFLKIGNWLVCSFVCSHVFFCLFCFSVHGVIKVLIKSFLDYEGLCKMNLSRKNQTNTRETTTFLLLGPC